MSTTTLRPRETDTIQGTAFGERTLKPIKWFAAFGALCLVIAFELIGFVHDHEVVDAPVSGVEVHVRLIFPGHALHDAL